MPAPVGKERHPDDEECGSGVSAGSSSLSSVKTGSGAESTSDDTSYGGTRMARAHRNTNANQEEHFGRTETKRLWAIKALFILILCGFCVSFSAWIYTFVKKTQQENFAVDFSDRAQKVFENFQINFEQDISAIDSLGIHLTSNARASETQDWPFVTLPDFDVRSASARQLSRGASILLSTCPLVTEEQRVDWAQYAYENQWWIQETLDRESLTDPTPGSQRRQTANIQPFGRHLQDAAVPEAPANASAVDNTTDLMIPELYTFPNLWPEPDPSDPNPGPYLPLWQSDPHLEFFVNFDILQSDDFKTAIQTAFESGEAVLSDFYNGTDFINMITADQEGFVYNEEPVSILYYPMFSNFSRTRKITGIMLQMLFWPAFFENILPQTENGYVVIIENDCGKQFTLSVDGPNVGYMGFGDLHDTDYDEYVETFEFLSILSGNLGQISSVTNIPLNKEFCPYSLWAYPSQTLQDEYIDNTPLLIALSTGLVFVVTAIIFLVYDCLVEKRQNVVMKTAVVSNAIVSSIFPEVVRDRLYQTVDKKSDGAIQEDFPALGAATTDTYAMSERMHPKRALKMQLNWGASKEAEESMAKGPLSKGFDLAKPIDDLFTDCTVFFADIAGFTAWSSQREPDQVFLLLQNVYQSFDEIARKLRVFKVETIGDCYLAVTGLPDPQVDHAVRMARFAREALRKMRDVTRALEVILGPETADLCIRIGLHSGPVIAGVLRGEKTRFQLFGDTVNTASRMESTGKKNCIQLSQATADELVRAGKRSWIVEREDCVMAKGKGEVNTFWMLEDNQGSNKEDSSADEGETSKLGMQLERLVDWQVDVLLEYLKHVVAARNQNPSETTYISPETLTQSAGGILGEVSEAIVLPRFQQEQNKKDGSTAAVDISPVVVSQLRDYVKGIAMSYRDNPFHNFQHASLVTLCATKFLHRIATPEEVNLADAADVHNYTYGITSDPLTQFTVILSALIHDADHPGIPNFQLAQESPELAAKYHNKSIAEQRSVDTAWDMLMEPGFKELRSYIYTNETEFKRFRQLLVNAVMATDIFDPDMKKLRDSRWEKVFSSSPDKSKVESDEVDLKATIVIEHIIQAADVAHTMQHWHIYQKWNQRLFEEMYSAYLAGRSEKDPSEGWFSGEIWFFDNYVIPLAKKLSECKVFGVSSDECLDYALSNRKEWEAKGERIVRDMIANHLQQNSQ